MSDTHRDGSGPGPAAVSIEDNSLPPPPSPPAEGGDTVANSWLGLVAILGAVVALGVFAGWVYVWIILGIVVMVFLHELGHFATAKWSGMKVTEFFIGAGPRVWSTRRGETEYGIKAVPVLAYVRIVGMNNLDDVDPADERRTYRQQSFPKRLLVVSAGSLMHFAQAWIILFLLVGVIGLPGGSLMNPGVDDRDWVVREVTPDSAAADAGLEPGDRIVAFDGEEVATFDALTRQIQASDVGDEVTLTIERGGDLLDARTRISGRPEEVSGAPGGTPFLGVAQGFEDETVGPLAAVGRASVETVEGGREVLVAFTRIFSPDGLGNFAENVSDGGSSEQEGGGGAAVRDDENRLVSIYGAVQVGRSLSEEGVAPALAFFFQLNMFIGIFNLVPLPPFDGGHAVVAIYERIRSRSGRRYHADMAKLLPLTYVVVMGLVVIGVSALYLDIVNPVDL